MRFTEKVATLHMSLDDNAARTEAATVLSTLIKSATIYPSDEHGAEAEVGAKVSDCWHGPQTTTPPVGAAVVVLVVWLRGQDLNL